MKAKKIIRILLFILLIVFLFVVTYIGIIRTIIAKKNVKDTLSTLTSGDYTNNFYYLNMNGDIHKYLDVGALGNAILQNSTYTPCDYDFNFKSPIASVTLDISYPDISEVYNQKYANSTEVIPSDVMQNELVIAVKNKNFNVINEKIKVDIVQYRNKWYILDNEELMNAYSGGLYKQYKQIITDKYEHEEE